MRRLLRFILLIAVFLGGYYLGRLPNSPDIFDYARQAYRRAVQAGERVSARARHDESSLPKAALNCAVDAVVEREKPEPESQRQ